MGVRLVAGIQKERQQRLYRECKKKRNLIPNLPLEHYTRGWVVDSAHGVAFRATAKVASSSWLNVMASAMSGIPINNLKYNKDVKPLRQYDLSKWVIHGIDDLKYALQGYKKFVFVRHPLSRLLSAYIGKMARKDYQEMYGYEIMKFSENKTTNYGENITFRDFVRYIIVTRKRAKYFNIHWKPFTLLLQPCQFDYNFIGNLETLQNDSEYIFQNLFRDPSLTLPRKNIANSKNDSGKIYTKSIQEYYNELTSQELAGIIEVYKDDFSIFGYEEIVPVS